MYLLDKLGALFWVYLYSMTLISSDLEPPTGIFLCGKSLLVIILDHSLYILSSKSMKFLCILQYLINIQKPSWVKKNNNTVYSKCP